MGVGFSAFHQLCGLSCMVSNSLGPSTAPLWDSGLHICLQGTCTLYPCPWGDRSQPTFPSPAGTYANSFPPGMKATCPHLQVT